MDRRSFLRVSARSLVGMGAWGLGTPLAYSLIWPTPAHAARYPAPMGMYAVRGSSELQEALERHAGPGIHIVLMPGSYDGTFQLKRGGTKEHPVVIRAQEDGAASIGGQLVLDGDHAVVDGLEIDGGSRHAVEMNGVGQRVTFCSIPSPRGILIPEGGNEFYVGNNDLTGSPDGGELADHISMWVEKGQRRSGVIERNLFTDEGGGGEDHVFYVGRHAEPEALDVLFQENWIKSAKRRGPYAKRGIVMRRNHIEMAGLGAVGFRGGAGGVMEENTIIAPKEILIDGPDHVARGNRWERCRVCVMADHRSSGGNSYRAAHNFVAEGNEGPDMILGYVAPGGGAVDPVQDVTMDHFRSDVIEGSHSGTRWGNGGRARTITLTREMVGTKASELPAATPPEFAVHDPEGGVYLPEGRSWEPEVYGQGYIKPESMRRVEVTKRPMPQGVRMRPAPSRSAGSPSALPTLGEIEALFGGRGA